MKLLAIAFALVAASTTAAQAAQKAPAKTAPTSAKVKAPEPEPPAPVIEPLGVYENENARISVIQDPKGVDDSEMLVSVNTDPQAPSCYFVTAGEYSTSTHKFKSHVSENECRLAIEFTPAGAKITKATIDCVSICKTPQELENTGELKKNP